MSPNGEEWHYLAVKILSALLRGVTSKHRRDFYCLNCLHSFTTGNKHKTHKKVCGNKYFCNVIMPSEDNKILEFNQYQKSDKAPFIIYADLECLTKKIDECIILKIHQKQKQVNIFHQVFQCLQYCHLKTQKISMTYTEVKIVRKSFVNP